ncbi:hypothetical protein A2U01_0050159, partial [Trifolium medium]|nr:hypothetical protein [Trifolium medium]
STEDNVGGSDGVVKEAAGDGCGELERCCRIVGGGNEGCCATAAEGGC